MLACSGHNNANRAWALVFCISPDDVVPEMSAGPCWVRVRAEGRLCPTLSFDSGGRAVVWFWYVQVLAKAEVLLIRWLPVLQWTAARALFLCQKVIYERQGMGNWPTTWPPVSRSHEISVSSSALMSASRQKGVVGLPVLRMVATPVVSVANVWKCLPDPAGWLEVSSAWFW